MILAFLNELELPESQIDTWATESQAQPVPEDYVQGKILAWIQNEQATNSGLVNFRDIPVAVLYLNRQAIYVVFGAGATVIDWEREVGTTVG